MTLNPLRHVDPMGTVVLPAMLLLVKAPFLFGWAKPVPVDFRSLPSPRRDMAIVAAAGPGINLVQAYIALLLFHLLPMFGQTVDQWVAQNLQNAIQINLILCVFNMLPLPPLDGGRVAVGLLPLALARPLARLERYGMVLLLILLLAVPLALSQFGIDWNPLFSVITPVVNWLADSCLLCRGTAVNNPSPNKFKIDLQRLRRGFQSSDRGCRDTCIRARRPTPRSVRGGRAF